MTGAEGVILYQRADDVVRRTLGQHRNVQRGGDMTGFTAFSTHADVYETIRHYLFT